MIVSFFIEIISQDGQTRRVPLQQGSLIVGRSRTSGQIVLNDSRVSRVHLQINRDFDRGVLVTDMRSANGTTLDGNVLTPNEPTHWSLGQVIGIGQTQLILKYGSVEESAESMEEDYRGEEPTMS